jgi:glutamate racemase
MISGAGTPGTVARDYTRELIETYAASHRVTLVGATRLAGLAEQALKGEAVDDAVLAAEIAPASSRRMAAAPMSSPSARIIPCC